jgi:hypothetical protein
MISSHWLIGGAATLCVVHITQQVPVRTLTVREVEYPEPFTRVADVRELHGGRVIVLDARDRAIVAIQMASAGATRVGRLGHGPGEYQMPVSLLALPGDTSLVLDAGNFGGALLITPRATTGEILHLSSGDGGPTRVWTIRNGTDAEGRVYSQVPVISVTAGRVALLSDSAAIERFDRSTGRRDTVARVSIRPVSPLTPSGNGRERTGSANGNFASYALIPFAIRDQWAVSSDGRVAIVTVEPFRVMFVEPSGVRRFGPPLRVAQIRVSEGHKTLWRQERQQPVAMLVYAGDQMTPQFMRPPYTEPVKWPEFLPPFLDRAVAFAPDGMLWIQRTTDIDAAPTFDVIDRAGQLAARCILPRRARLIGFGATSIYLVRRDNDDLEYLQRYHLPSF